MTTPSSPETLLSRWLAQEPGAEPPEGLDPEAVEAVYALRPDLAPPHRVSIEQVLELVAEGPFAREEQAPAAALAQALEGQGELPEAVYALRPDLAPPHRVSIEQVLAEVREGPFAPKAAARVTPRQAQAEPRRGAVSRRRMPSWAIPALGGLAVVATALMVVLPGSEKVLNAPSPFAAEEMAPAPASLATGSPAPGSPAPGSPAPAATPVEDLVPMDPVVVSGSGGLGARGTGEARQAPAPPAEAAKADEPPAARWEEDRAEAESARRGAELDAGPLEESASTGAAALDDREQSTRERTKDEKKPSRAVSDVAVSENAEAESLSSKSAASEPAPPPASAPAPISDADEASLGAAAGGAVGATPSGRSSARAPSAPQTLSPGAPSADSLESLRAQASPVGGFPDPTVGRPDVAAAHAAAAEVDARGDDSAFVAALQPLLAHAEVDVAQDAAWRIARRQLSLGQTTSALATLRQGLARGGSALQRARLYALEGQVYERMGNAERAANSYRKAVMAR